MQGPRAEELAATLHPDTDKVNGFPGCGKQLTQGYPGEIARQKPESKIKIQFDVKEGCRTCVTLLLGSACIWFPGCCGAYFEAHLACSALAWKTPSRPKLPSASACESSLKVSGGASVPVYETGSVSSFSFSMKSTRVPERLIEPGTTFPATRRCLE